MTNLNNTQTNNIFHKNKYKHKLPSLFVNLVDEIDTSNLLGFGLTKPKQFDNLLNGVLQTKNEKFVLLFNKELDNYYSELKQGINKAS
ncbi:MAG: hypothetical protein ACPG46_06535 [Thalassotalea sp.]